MLPTGMPSLALISAYGTRVVDEQGEQLLAARGQLPERLAKGSVPFGREQVLLGCLGVIVGDGLGGQRMPGAAGSPGRAQDAAAFAPGGGRQPAGKRGWVADLVQLIQKLEPDVLGDVLGVGGVDPVPAADGPDQRGIPFHQRVPGLLLAVPGPGHQAGDHRSSHPGLACWVRAGFAVMAFS